jgi:hypothetical protein
MESEALDLITYLGSLGSDAGDIVSILAMAFGGYMPDVTELQEGDLVIAEDPTMPQGMRMGFVHRLFTSEDGAVYAHIRLSPVDFVTYPLTCIRRV